MGLKISYAKQSSSYGLAQAFIISEEFIGNDNVCLVSGNKIFSRAGFKSLSEASVKTVEEEKKAVVFSYYIEGVTNIDILLPSCNIGSSILTYFSRIHHLFVIRHPNRDILQGYLSNIGIQNLVQYPIPAHKQIS